jgi:hypothetical protein
VGWGFEGGMGKIVVATWTLFVLSGASCPLRENLVIRRGKNFINRITGQPVKYRNSFNANFVFMNWSLLPFL